MAILAGETVVDRVYIEDAGGLPSALGAATVFSLATAYSPGGSTITPTVLATAVPGVYEIRFSTNRAEAGLYTIILVSSETGVHYLGSYDVDPISPLPLPSNSASPPSPSPTSAPPSATAFRTTCASSPPATARRASLRTP